MSMIDSMWTPSGSFSHGPGCTCGCQSGWGNLQDCWREIAELKQLIRSVVTGMDRNGPILGVVDGSDAKPGEVGEHYSNQINDLQMPVTESHTQNVNLGVVPPGDWLCMATLWPSVGNQGISFELSPVPTGLSTGMSGMLFVSGPPLATEGSVINSFPARASLKVPTLFAFAVHSNIAGQGSVAGTMSMQLQAWRVR